MSDQQILEVVLLASFYVMVASVLRSLDVDAEPGDVELGES